MDIVCDRPLPDGTCTHAIILEGVRVLDVCNLPKGDYRVIVSANAAQIKILTDAAKHGQLRAIPRALDD